MDLASKTFGRPTGYTVLPAWMLYATALFIPAMRGLLEMLYQNKYDYLFDSSDFEKTFAFTPTSYEEGTRIIYQSFAQS